MQSASMYTTREYSVQDHMCSRPKLSICISGSVTGGVHLATYKRTGGWKTLTSRNSFLNHGYLTTCFAGLGLEIPEWILGDLRGFTFLYCRIRIRGVPWDSPAARKNGAGFNKSGSMCPQGPMESNKIIPPAGRRQS